MFDEKKYLEKLEKIRQIRRLSMDRLARELNLSTPTVNRALGKGKKQDHKLGMKSQYLIKEYVDKHERIIDGE